MPSPFSPVSHCHRKTTIFPDERFSRMGTSSQANKTPGKDAVAQDRVPRGESRNIARSHPRLKEHPEPPQRTREKHCRYRDSDRVRADL